MGLFFCLILQQLLLSVSNYMIHRPINSIPNFKAIFRLV